MELHLKASGRKNSLIRADSISPFRLKTKVHDKIEYDFIVNLFFLSQVKLWLFFSKTKNRLC